MPISFTLGVEHEGLSRKLHLLAEQAEDLTRPLQRIGGHLRGKAAKRFAAQGPGWAKHADATLARKPDAQATALVQRLGKGQKAPVDTIMALARKMERAQESARKFESQWSGVQSSAQARRSAVGLRNAISRLRVARGTLRRLAVTYSGKRKFEDVAALVAFAQHELHRRRLHGVALAAARGIKDIAARRRVSRIAKRRYNASENAGRMLGDLDRTITILIAGASVEVGSHAFIGAIHNKGGTAGHGAIIPARTFIDLDSQDLDVAVDILREHLLAAWVT